MQKIFIFLGAIFFALTVNAQSVDGNGNTNNNAKDSTHRYGMHRSWGHRDGSDTLHHRDGQAFSRDWRGEGRPGGDRQGFRSFRRPGDGWAGGPGMGREGARRLHYTPEQRKQIRDINTDYHKKAADLFKNDNMTLGQYKAGLIALQKEKKAKLQGLLTPEQKDRLAKGKQRAAENAQVMAAARMERLKIRLGLSDQQVATLRSKEEALHTQLRSIHENEDLLPQQKMEQFKELASKRKDMIKSVLTPDQLTKFNEMEMAHQSHRPMDGDRRMPMDGEGK